MTILYIARRMLLHRRARVVATLLGRAALFFLSAFQVAVFVGWWDTTQLLVRHAGVDIWVMAEYTTALEYGSPIPRHRVEQVRNVPGVAWAEALHLSSSVWRRADGRCTTVSVIGLDKSCAGGPWALPRGRVEDVHLPNGVIVDELYLERPCSLASPTFSVSGRRDSLSHARFIPWPGAAPALPTCLLPFSVTSPFRDRS